MRSPCGWSTTPPARKAPSSTGPSSSTRANAMSGSWVLSQAGQGPLFGPSGLHHSPGAVPDPGSTAGTTRFLREDGTWQVAPGTPTVITPLYPTDNGNANLVSQRNGSNPQTFDWYATWDAQPPVNYER